MKNKGKCMPETKLGDATCGIGDSVAWSATSPVSTCIHRESLFDEFALLLPRDDGPTAALVARRGASGGRSQRVCEAFVDVNYLRETENIPATAENLTRTLLCELFEADENKAIYPLWLKDDCGPSGLLLIKAGLGRRNDEFRHTCEQNELALKYLLLGVRDAVRGYETLIMRYMLEHQCPCVVVDERRRVVFANRQLLDVAGLTGAEVLGADLESILKFDTSNDTAETAGPEPRKVITPVFMVPLSILITASMEVCTMNTPCGARTLLAFENLGSKEDIDESDAGLIQRFSELALSDEPPAGLIRSMLTSLASSLSCNLACVVKQSSKTELIVTPHSSRRVYSLGVRLLSLTADPELQPFFKTGRPVICDNVHGACREESFFKRALSISAFALLPLKDVESAHCGLLLTWRSSMSHSSPEKMTTLMSIANILGSVFKRVRVLADLDHERDSRRRYTRLMTGREVRMAELKSENAKLKELLMELSNKRSETEQA